MDSSDNGGDLELDTIQLDICLTRADKLQLEQILLHV